jgi:hypothetical protein
LASCDATVAAAGWAPAQTVSTVQCNSARLPACKHTGEPDSTSGANSLLVAGRLCLPAGRRFKRHTSTALIMADSKEGCSTVLVRVRA